MSKILDSTGLSQLSSDIKKYVDEHSGGEGAKEVYIGTDEPTGRSEVIWINPEGGETTLAKVAYSNDYNDLDNLPTDLGKVDDVKVNGESVVTDKIANITIPDGPETYIKDATVADNKLTLTKQDDTTVEFEGGGKEFPDAWSMSLRNFTSGKYFGSANSYSRELTIGFTVFATITEAMSSETYVSVNVGGTPLGNYYDVKYGTTDWAKQLSVGDSILLQFRGTYFELIGYWPASSGSTPTNMVTTDTDQTITGLKKIRNTLEISNAYGGVKLIGKNPAILEIVSDSKNAGNSFGFAIDVDPGGGTTPNISPNYDNFHNLGKTSLRYKTIYAVYLSAGSGKTKSLEQMIAQCPNPPTTDGNYVLKCTVSGGVATYSWEAN